MVVLCYFVILEFEKPSMHCWQVDKLSQNVGSCAISIHKSNSQLQNVASVM